MEKVFATIGEPLVVFASQDVDTDLVDAVNFKKFVAGAELNVAIGIARLGHKSRYISSVGKDIFGEFILKEIKKSNIDISNINIDERFNTGYYFKQKVSSGDPKVIYMRKNSAASNYELKDNVDLSNVSVLHLSGIMLAISKKAYDAVEKLIDKARKKEILISFDPNLRPTLWETQEIMIEKINYIASKVNIFMPGVSEARLLTGLNELEEIADFYLKSEQTKIVIIKNGSKGAFVKEKGKKSFEVSSYKVEKVIDTVGAGDGFAVGVLSSILEGLKLNQAVKRACAIGALAVQSLGDNDGYPTREKLNDYMSERG